MYHYVYVYARYLHPLDILEGTSTAFLLLLIAGARYQVHQYVAGSIHTVHMSLAQSTNRMKNQYRHWVCWMLSVDSGQKERRQHT